MKPAGVSIALCLIFAFLAFLPAFASADRGMIPPTPPTSSPGQPPIPPYQVFEPRQQAVVAWNDGREVLVLATTVYASAPTRVLELIPLPSEPLVEKGDWTTFDYLKRFLPTPAPQPLWERVGTTKAGIEIVFHKRVGVHVLTTVRAESVGDLVGFARGYEAASGLRYEFDELEAILEGYITRGIKYFVFDLVEVTTEPLDIKPVVYSFASEFVYYPLEISSKTKGEGEVIVYTITPKNAKQVSDASDPRLPSRAPLDLLGKHSLNAYDLMKVGKNVSVLFARDAANAELSVYHYSGPLSSLQQDFVLKLEKPFFSTLPTMFPPTQPSDANYFIWLAVGTLLVLAAISFTIIQWFKQAR